MWYDFRPICVDQSPLRTWATNALWQQPTANKLDELLLGASILTTNGYPATGGMPILVVHGGAS